MAETLSMISIISFIAAVFFAAVAIALWFIFKMPSVIGYLSGRTARKSMERMRQDNTKSDVRAYAKSEKKRERKQIIKEGAMANVNNTAKETAETGLLSENRAKPTVSQETGLLIDEEATGLLASEKETASLDNEAVKEKRRASTVKVKLLEEVMYIHTEEVI